MARQIRPFRGPDGTNWGVEVQVPGASNAMIVFHHPDGKTARHDRYAWDIWSGPESRSVAIDTIDASGLFLHPRPASLTVEKGGTWLRIGAEAAIDVRRGADPRSELVRALASPSGPGA